MDQLHEQRLADLKRRIERGEYRVDPHAVADAIIERLGEIKRAARAARSEVQNECSYPDRESGESVNTSPSPSFTRPTQISPKLVFVLRMLGGMQTQSW